jgi:RND family efflux transporter MFP subunit
MAKRLTLVLAALPLLALASCDSGKEAAAPVATKPQGSSMTLAMTAIPDIKTVSAEITSRDQAEARARIPGTLINLSVTAGDSVTKGQRIGIVVDNRLGFETGAAEAGVAAAEAEAVRARAELARIEDLYRNKVYAKARLDSAVAGARAADAAANAARARAGASNAIAGQGAVIAPASGRVLRADVPAGSVVSPGQSIATITAGPPVLRLTLPESLAASLRMGAPVTLAEPINGVATGQISRIYPAITAGQVMADATLPGLDPRFIGRRVGASIEVGSRNAIAVPKAWVTTRFGVDYVDIVSGDTVSAVPVQTSPLQGGRVEILSGVGAGDRIFRASGAPQ